MDASTDKNYLKITPNRSVILGMVLLCFLYLFSYYFGQFLRSKHVDSDNLFYISILVKWLNLILIFFYCQKFEKQKFLLWSEKSHPLLSYVKSIIALFFVLIGGTIIIGTILKLLGFNQDSKQINDILNLVHNNKWLTVFIPLTAGVTEELIFRGFLIPRLQLFFKRSYPAIIISSVLFGILHITYGTVSHVIVPTFIGLIFGIHYHKYRNIKILILFHFVWDLIFFLIFNF